MGTGVLSETGPLPQESKLRVPAIRYGVVARARLAALQMVAERSRLVLVSAPAGYGKSTLVAQWSDLDPRTSCWLQLGCGDNDPVVLLLRVAAALERSGSVDVELLSELSGRAPRIDEVALPLLAADLEVRDPFVLVLDDVDVITAERSRAILAFLVDQVPSGSQLVLATRGDPGVPLGRVRAGGELVEIGTGQLALDVNETRDVAASGGLELSEDAAEALRERTEGWVAGVVLAALSLRGREDADARAAGLSGDQIQIADYLLEEVLERQPEHLKRFLLGTSILERMTPSLCDAVLGTTDAAASLEALARSNAFLVPMDDHREWYRYHHLFRELLRAELGRRYPGLLPMYGRRAASWCELYGNPGLAFKYAYESGELAQAGRVALAHRDEFAMRGQSETVRLWLDRCTDEEIDSDPRLALAAAWVCFYGGDGARARRFIAAAERWPLVEASADGASSLRSSLASLRTIVAPDGIRQMLRDAEFAYASEKQAGTDGLLAPAARWEWHTFSWVGRRRRTPCCGRDSRCCAINPSSPTCGSSVSAISCSRPQSWAIGEISSDGQSKPPGWSTKHTSRRRRAVPSLTRRERLLTSNAVTTRRPHASSSTYGGCAATSARRYGPISISRCGAPTSASTLATRPRRSSSRRSRATDCRDTRTPERLRAACGVSRSGSGKDRTTGSRRPSSASSASLRHISRSRRSPIGCTSHAQQSRPTSRRSTTSSASQADPKRSRSSRSSASDRQP